MTHYEQIFGIYEPKTSSRYCSIAFGGPNNGNSILGCSLDGGLHEDLDLTNHGAKPLRFQLEIALRSDLADISEVKLSVDPHDGVVRRAARTRHHLPPRHRGVRIRISTGSPLAPPDRGPDDMVLLPAAGWPLAHRPVRWRQSDRLAAEPADPSSLRQRCTGNTTVVSGTRAGCLS